MIKRLIFLIVFLLITSPLVAAGESDYYFFNYGSSTPTYLLNAPWTAANQTFTDTQVLDTVAEGVTTGSLTVVDTSTGVVEIDTNKLKLTGSTSWTTTGLYGTGYTRTLGTSLMGTITPENPGYTMFGFYTAAALSNTPEHGFYFINGTLRVMQQGASIILNNLTASTPYQTIFILGGYDDGGLGQAYKIGDAESSYEYGGSHFIKGGTQYPTWTLVWKANIGTTATLYPEVNQYSNPHTIHAIKIPDADLSSVLQPNNLSLFSGSASELSDYTPDVGGVWTETSGDWDTNGSGALINTTSGYATFTGAADVLYDANITIPANASARSAWMIVRGLDYTGASEDFEGVKITTETAGSDAEYIQYVAGTPTTLASADVDWAASTAYDGGIIVSGNNFRYFYVNGVSKIAYTTVNNTGIAYTSTGLKDEGNAVFTFDNVGVWLRTSASQYDAVFDLY